MLQNARRYPFVVAATIVVIGLVAGMLLVRSRTDAGNRLDFGDASLTVSVGKPPGPALTDLTIEGQGVSFFPAFEPEILRYAIVLGPDTEQVTIKPEAAADVTLLFEERFRPAGLTLNVDQLDEFRSTNKSLTAEAPGIAGIREYEFVVVPPDYPIRPTFTAASVRSANDFDLYTTPRSSAGDGFVIKSDGNGVPYFWIVDRSDATVEAQSDPRAGFRDFKQHPDGTYSYAARAGRNDSGSDDYEIVLLDHAFDELDRVAAVGPDIGHTDFHDFRILRNGNHAFLAFNSREHNGQAAEGSIVQVVNPATGEEVLRWESWDELASEADRLEADVREYTRIDSVAEGPDGDLIVSVPSASSVFKIDGETGERIWTFGGQRSDFEIDDPWGGPCGQRTASIRDNGNLVLFDNGRSCADAPDSQGRPEPGSARYAEYSIDEDAMEASLVREIVLPDHDTGPVGSVQHLVNDHVLVSWGFPDQDFDAYSIAEYDAEGELVRRFELAGGSTRMVSDRAYYAIDPDYPTTVGQGGASHRIAGPALGRLVDAETDGQPNIDFGDDTDLGVTAVALSDDDGVSFSGPLARGGEIAIAVRATESAVLQGWIDYNRDGDWADANEHVVVNESVLAGLSTLRVVVPEDATLGFTFARFRLSTETDLGPQGPAPDGEVEDYRLQITRQAGQ